jgi:hypothetical protein
MITPQQFQEFQEHYAWQLLQSPDYRLGQAFLNYFPEVSRDMASEDDGSLLEMKLYYETDDDLAKRIINQWVSGLDQ